MTAQFVLGIDLGTTNSVLAYTRLGGDAPQVELLRIPQLVDENTIDDRGSLASFCLLSGGSSAPDAATVQEGAGSLDLPWATGRNYCVGEYARRQAAERPERTISAAKSWLSHSRVDRRAPILPWQAPKDVEKISPVVAAQRYLEHLVAAWTAAFPEAPIGDQSVVLTVPASFDAVARELTREAALAAGLPADLILVEEPQAAVYSWLAASGGFLAVFAESGRSTLGLRCRGRHDRSHLDRDRGTGWRIGACAACRRQSSLGGRR